MSYVKIWIHCVWGTKNRVHFLNKENKWVIIDHIRSNAKEKGVFIDTINGDKQHLHALISLTAIQSAAEVMHLIKGESSFWINKNKIVKGDFHWADKYYAVSVSDSNVDAVRNYIKNQEEHHRRETWEEECDEFVKNFGFERIAG
jgi:REP element-mobilizing transposase RayT